MYKKGKNSMFETLKQIYQNEYAGELEINLNGGKNYNFIIPDEFAGINNDDTVEFVKNGNRITIEPLYIAALRWDTNEQ